MCLSVREHISGTAGPIRTKFWMRVLCGRGSVLLRRRCTTLRTSGFVDDVTVGRNGCDAERWRVIRAATVMPCSTKAESAVCECLLLCNVIVMCSFVTVTRCNSAELQWCWMLINDYWSILSPTQCNAMRCINNSFWLQCRPIWIFVKFAGVKPV